MILDTTVLIDLYREALRGRQGAAYAFIAEYRHESMRISVVTFAEFAEGFPPDRKELCVDLLRHYAVLEITESVAWRYAETSRLLRARGERLNDNDLWIAATALTHGLPLATRDFSHFRRIEALQVLSY